MIDYTVVTVVTEATSSNLRSRLIKNTHFYQYYRNE